MPAGGTGLARVRRVHSHHLPSSFFRFGAARRVKNIDHEASAIRFREVSFFHQRTHDQRLDRQQPKADDQLARFLLDEVLAPVANAFVDARHDVAFLLAFFRAFGSPGELAGSPRQCGLVFAEKAGIGNGFSGAQVGKGVEANVNANGFLTGMAIGC
ncbi:hypothetical protein Krac_9485 [Ktedonobacter racemifer DSM 44963]|uniref:Uncharacterized protein n=1 Tax=Ktedonobacter racemifer DSM 44963 TaxID=485913 RepID=D6TC60_KTERA|nr:hypothetical protein Krac_9485 [Ktedonobacter racemifer DSM 44963]